MVYLQLIGMHTNVIIKLRGIQMKKKYSFKKAVTVLLSVLMLLSSITMSYASNVTIVGSVELQKRNDILSEARTINEDLESKSIDVINEIEKMKEEMQERLKEVSDQDMILQIESEIKNYENMIDWYQQHTLSETIDIYSKANTISSMESIEYNVVKAQIIAMIGIGYASGLGLSAELLSHSMNAKEHEWYTTTTRVFDIIMSKTGTSMRRYATGRINAGETSGAYSDRFAPGASTTEMDLYLAIHRTAYIFSGSKTSNLITFGIRDVYDFESTSNYTMGIGYAVDTAIRAHELGIIKYYLLDIPFETYKLN